MDQCADRRGPHPARTWHTADRRTEKQPHPYLDRGARVHWRTRPGRPRAAGGPPRPAHPRHLELYPDADAAIRWAAQRFQVTGIITNGPSDVQWGEVRAVGLEERVDRVIVAGDVGAFKPDRASSKRPSKVLESRPSPPYSSETPPTTTSPAPSRPAGPPSGSTATAKPIPHRSQHPPPPPPPSANSQLSSPDAATEHVEFVSAYPERVDRSAGAARGKLDYRGES